MGANLRERARSAAGDLLVSEQRPVVNEQDAVEQGVASLQSQLAAVMPTDGETGRRIVADAIQAIRGNAELRKCDPVSIIGGLVTCAQLDLRPGVGGEAWLIPMRVNKRQPDGSWARGMHAQLIIGAQGHLTLARRSPELGDVQVVRIYENDRFVFSWDYDRLVHEPDWRDPGPVIGWYAVVKLTNGTVRVERPWTVQMMEEHRDKFAMARKGGKNGQVVGPWVDHFEAMADKTMLLRALKYAPRSYELVQGLYADGSVRTNVSESVSVFEAARPAEELAAGPVEGVVDDGDEDGGDRDEHAV